MTHKFLSTVAKRKAMAALVSRVASECLGLSIVLTPSEFHPGEYDIRLEELETTRGPLRHLCFSVCPRGVDMHSQFSFREFAPSGTGSSGKFNHYIWPHADDTAETYAGQVEVTLRRILRDIEIVDATRADRPSMVDCWIYERELMRKAAVA